MNEESRQSKIVTAGREEQVQNVQPSQDASAGTALAGIVDGRAGYAGRAGPGPADSAASRGRQKPNILVIFGDDIGQTNVSAYSMGLMGYRTPNIDRIAKEGMIFTDYYAEQSCTAGRSTFITGQCDPAHRPVQGRPARRRPSACRPSDITIAEALKPLGYATGQFGKNHLGDKNEFLPTVHGFDEFFGNLYHLNAEEEPEQPQLSAGPQVPREVRPARRAASRRRRDDPTVSRAGAGRQADDRGHRPAHQQAHGDDRRRDLGRGDRLHASARPRPSKPFFVLVEHHPHARPHPRAAEHRRPAGPDRPHRICRRHDRARRARRHSCSRRSTTSASPTTPS